MSRNYCKPMVQVEERVDVKFTIPTGVTLKPGQIIKAENIEPTLVGEGNYSVYTAELPTTGDDYAIILNGGFKTLEDKNRPNGYPDYTAYEFIGGTGDVYTALRLAEYTTFQITQDCVDLDGGTANVGNFLEPDGYNLKLTATKPTSGKYFEIKAKKGFQGGGQFGGQRTGGIIPAFVCMVKKA